MKKKLKDLYCQRPHVVIVGAGASRAVMGKSCPTMNEAIEQVGLDRILEGFMLETKSKNLEDIYSELFRRGDECKNARIAMEKKLYEYFSNVQLPSFLTIYDLLILSLTEKDCIVSFNWDSLLIQAYNRVAKITWNRPKILFLHGNVGAGVCKDCMTFGLIQNYCRKCGKPYNAVPLLYPVEQKDYNSDSFIRDQWSVAKYYISKAGKVTIFGYSAPSSDKEASEILKAAFSKHDGVHRLDADIVDSFYNSYLAQAPRRTLQYQYQQFIRGWWGQPKIHFSKQDTFESVETLLKPLLVNEEQGDYSII